MESKLKYVIAAIALLLMISDVSAQYNERSERPLYKSFSPLVLPDSLIIERATGLKIKMTWPYRDNVNKNVKWEQLLIEFQNNFSKVVDEVPDYDFYRIDYSSNQKMTISEVRELDIYTVSSDDELRYIRSNTCVLKGAGFTLEIEFDEKQELLDESLIEDMSKAISKVKSRFYISSVSQDRYYYSVSDDKMIPNPKVKKEFFIPIGARAGFRQNAPYIELRQGIGLHTRKFNYISLNADVIVQYDQVANQSQYDTYLSFNWASLGAGVGTEFGYRVLNGIDGTEGLDWKIGLNYKTDNGLIVGVDYYLGPRGSSGVLWGFSFGFGF